MKTYCFKCRTCGTRAQQSVLDPAPTCRVEAEVPLFGASDHGVMARDYYLEHASAIIREFSGERIPAGGMPDRVRRT